MRVITGIAKGTKINTLPGYDVRPTAEQVKEALFSSIQFQLPNSNVLDLFAGSGQLGIEALSRGAAFAAFCEQSASAYSIIEKNITACKFDSESFYLHKGDFSSYLKFTEKKFDFCFVDPPYASGLYESALVQLGRVMKQDGAVFCEHSKEVFLPEEIGLFIKVKEYRFSKIIISKYCFKEAKE